MSAPARRATRYIAIVFDRGQFGRRQDALAGHETAAYLELRSPDLLDRVSRAGRGVCQRSWGELLCGHVRWRQLRELLSDSGLRVLR